MTGGGGTWIGGGGTGAGGAGGTGIGTVTVTGRVGSVTVGRVSVSCPGPPWPEAAAVQKPSTAIAAKSAPRQIKWSRRSVFTPK